jgi:protein-tyrosine phosphatase
MYVFFHSLQQGLILTKTSLQQQPPTVSMTDTAVTVSLSKSSSLRRRRHSSSDGVDSDQANPIKKGNYTVEVESQITATVSMPKKQAAAVQQVGKDQENVAQIDRQVISMISDEDDEDDDVVDPLSFIEIKSAAQWKAMSERISWKFEDSDKEKKKKKKQAEPTRVNFSIKAKETAAAAAAVTSEGSFKPTKVEQMRLVCWKVKPWNQPKPRPGQSRLYSSQFAIPWGVDCDEVYPGLFIGDKKAATNIKFLQKIGVTHVLNTAEGQDEGLVDLTQGHYEESSTIKYLGFPLWDTPMCNIIPYMGCAAEYIAQAINECGGKCMVNCQMGVSRSSSCAMAYMMIKKQMNAIDVLTQFRCHRDIRPNDGFLEQIVALDNDLRRQRECGASPTIQLSTMADHSQLPQAWNYEFWTTEVTEEEIGLPLVKLGEPCPLYSAAPSTRYPCATSWFAKVMYTLPYFRSSSRRSSQPLSRRVSFSRRMSSGGSFRSSKRDSVRNSTRGSIQSSR